MKVKRNKNMSMTIIILVCVFGSLFADKFFKNDSPFDERLQNAAVQANQKCPVFLDRETRLDSTAAGTGKIFTYNYSLIHMTAQEVNATELSSSLWPRFIKTIRTEPDLKTFRKNSVTMIHRYFDKNGEFIFDLTIRPEDYLAAVKDGEDVIKDK